MARKVAQVHAERDPERRLPAILATLLALSAELADHMAREEEMLFPSILAGGAGEAGAPLQPFVDDHTAAGEKLARLRVLTDDYTPPADACNTWRALWGGLADLERTMHQHVHLENNVLFARASAGCERAAAEPLGRRSL
jgi:regulator of cell morphogenesis and NO signaling